MKIVSFIKINCIVLLLGLISCNDDDMPRNHGVLFEFTASTVPWNNTDVSTRGSETKPKVNIISLEAFSGDDEEELCLIEETGISPVEDVETIQHNSEAATRGAVKESFAVGDKFKFSAFVSGLDQSDYAYYDEAIGTFKESTVGSTQSEWEPEKEGYWPSSSKVIQFYAWWPYGDDDGVTFNKSSKAIEYECKLTSETQKDLLYASSDPLNYVVDQVLGVHLKFKHALTAVSIRAGSGMPSGVKIKSIKLEGFSDTGTFLPNVGAWVVEDLAKDFTVSNINITADGNTNVILNGDGKTFLMIPQNVDGKKIVITTESGKTFYATLSGGWAPGTTVTYTIGKRQSAEYRFYHTIHLDYFYDITNSATLQSRSFGMVSYKIIPNGESATYEPVKWKVTEMSKNNVDFIKPTSDLWDGWISNATQIIGQGSTGYNNYSYATMQFVLNTPTSYGTAWDNDQKLKNAEVVEERIDLSKRDTRGNALSHTCTSNCYVVSAGGEYEFPAVYGNGVVNGREDANTYNYSNFRNMRGQLLTSAFIYLDQNSSLHPTSAKLMWNDERINNVVKNVSYNSSTKMIEFEVDKDNIVQGNAVIGLYDAANGTGNLLWSWHIWITPVMTATDGSVDNGTATYHFSPDNLGMIYDGYQNYYPRRTVYLKCQQVDDDYNVIPNTKSYVILYYHDAYTTGSTGFYYPLFQFGSKDVRPSSSADIQGATVYMNIPNGNNLWNGNITTQLGFNDLPVQKTIYDPCPYGYHLPSSNAFSTFQNYDSWEFGRSYGSIRFRCANEGGVYWTANPFDNSNVCAFRIANGISNPSYYVSRNNTCIVRPVTD